MLTHNQLTINTGFDAALLQTELDEIENFNMSEYSFWDGESEFFDDEEPEVAGEREPKGVIIAIANEAQAAGLTEFLIENNIEFEVK